MRKWARIKVLLFFLVLATPIILWSQTVTLKGKVIVKNDRGGIHVINTTQNKFSITDEDGEFFIYASLNDSIYFSALQYEPKTIIVDSYMMATKSILVELVDRVTELDEVVIGKILTGDLRSDIENSDAKADLNFYDLGIPGYTGKQKTQNERRLYEADAGKFVYYYGIGFAINVHKILNRISGRTKEMKNRVRVESQDLCIKQVRAYFSESLFANQEVPDQVITEYFYYASDDDRFLELCSNKNNMVMYQYLVSKLVAFNSDDLETDH